jgi:ubiquinone/menaquinone biosynthesis C-methylase UbiE
MRQSVDVNRVLEQNRRYHDEVEANVYDNRMGITNDSFTTGQMIAELERVLGRPLPTNCTVVDVGAGTGNVAIKLAMSGRFDRIIAADISEGMLAQARASAQAAGCSIETVQTDMARLPFEDESIDLVVGCAVLHHLPDPVAFMAEVKRVLKPGGSCIFIGEPSTWGKRIIETLKLPLVSANRVYKLVSGRPGIQWEHDNIDVHTFSISDVMRMTVSYQNVRLVPEGFLETVLDQSFFTAIRYMQGRVPGVIPAVTAIRRICRTLDQSLLNRIVPRDLRTDMKFSAMKPARAGTASVP